MVKSPSGTRIVLALSIRTVVPPARITSALPRVEAIPRASARVLTASDLPSRNRTTMGPRASSVLVLGPPPASGSLPAVAVGFGTGDGEIRQRDDGGHHDDDPRRHRRDQDDPGRGFAQLRQLAREPGQGRRRAQVRGRCLDPGLGFGLGLGFRGQLQAIAQQFVGAEVEGEERVSHADSASRTRALRTAPGADDPRDLVSRAR